MLRIILLLAVFAITLKSLAASVDTVIIYSNSMRKNIKCVIVKPDTYNKKNTRYPVVYLLHGHSDYFYGWVTKIPEIKSYADQMQILIVCPDGGFNSWYFDSPVDSSSQYETHITKEVISYTDTHYLTIPNRKKRAICGLSMGGHGAFYLALRHTDLFGAVGSMSGGVDIRPFPNNWQIKEKIGDIITHRDEWDRKSIVNMIDKYPADSLAIIFDCGTNDFFLNVNQQLHKKMMQLKIPHDYIERPGEHNWPYWKNAVEYQLIFFKNYFRN
ncbi:MAG TPA: alpha/beta hydrolase family protein [Chitinophagaceae bacterium]|nr:alpha/beta hydrolase family protein [Chitinophagaceae bacterium]